MLKFIITNVKVGATDCELINCHATHPAISMLWHTSPSIFMAMIHTMGRRHSSWTSKKIQNFYRRWRNDCNQNNICFNFCLRPDSYGWYFDSPLTSGYWWHPIISNDWCLGTLSQGNFSHRFFRLCHFARGIHTTHIICIGSYITFFDMLLAQKKTISCLTQLTPWLHFDTYHFDRKFSEKKKSEDVT